jgi:hypothetical protein
MEKNISKGKKKSKGVLRAILLVLLCANLIIVPVAKDTYGLSWGDAARIGAAVATGGVSELVIRAVDTLLDLMANITNMIATITAGINNTMQKAKNDIEGEIGTITDAFEDSKRAIQKTFRDASYFIARYEGGREVDGQLANSPGTPLPGQQGGDNIIEDPSAGSSESETPESHPSRPEMARMERADNIALTEQAGQQMATARSPLLSQREQQCPEYVQSGDFGGAGKVALIPVVPADRETVLASLKSGEDKIRTLKSHTDINLKYSVDSKIDDANWELSNGWDGVKAWALIILDDPLEGALDTVSYYLDHPWELIEAVVDPLAPVNRTIEEINNKMDQTLQELYDKLTREPMKNLSKTEGDIRSARANAELAQDIYQKMADLEFCPNQTKIASLDTLINISSDSMLAQVEGLNVGGMTAQYTPNTAATNQNKTIEGRI